MLLFPTPAGRIWHESNFRRDVWIPALAAHLGITREESEPQWRFAARCRAKVHGRLAPGFGHLRLDEDVSERSLRAA